MHLGVDPGAYYGDVIGALSDDDSDDDYGRPAKKKATKKASKKGTLLYIETSHTIPLITAPHMHQNESTTTYKFVNINQKHR